MSASASRRLLWQRLGITVAAIAVVGFAVYSYVIAPIILPVPVEPAPTAGSPAAAGLAPPPTENDAKRRSDAHALEQALAAYFKDHAAYPLSPLGTTCSAGNYDNVPGLAAALAPYLAEMPRDPLPKACEYNYFYVSDGKNYILMIHLDSVDGTKYADHWCFGASAGTVPAYEGSFRPCPQA